MIYTKADIITARKWIAKNGKAAMLRQDKTSLDVLNIFSFLLGEIPTIKANGKVRKYLKEHSTISIAQYNKLQPPRVGKNINHPRRR